MHMLTKEQEEELVREAKCRLMDDEWERVNRRHSTMASRVETESPASVHAGPSKGKAPDPREWGAVGLEEDELDMEAQ
jgi:hypothetical protein